MQCVEEIEYKGYSLRISFDYDKGWPGSNLEPPEPRTIEIEKVHLLYQVRACGLNEQIEIDIFDLLAEIQFAEIEELLWEKQDDGY